MYLEPDDWDLIKEEETFGKKTDRGKEDWHCVPLELVELLVPVFEYGVKKYGRFNCLKPFDDYDRRFYSAKMRHTRASQLNPLAKDKESGLYHEAQVAFSALLRLHNALREGGQCESKQGK